MNTEKRRREDSVASTGDGGRGENECLTVDGACRVGGGVRVTVLRLEGTELWTTGRNGDQSRQVALQAELEKLNKKDGVRGEKDGGKEEGGGIEKTEGGREGGRAV